MALGQDVRVDVGLALAPVAIGQVRPVGALVVSLATRLLLYELVQSEEPSLVAFARVLWQLVNYYPGHVAFLQD